MGNQGAKSTHMELQGVVDEASKRLFDEATRADTILRASATITWIEEYDAEPPESEIPDAGSLGQWWQDQGAEMVHGGHESVWNLFRHYFGYSGDTPATKPVLTNPKDGADLALEFFMSLYGKEIDANIIECGHKAWIKARREGYNGEHPLATIVEAWQESHPLPAKRYPTAIMPRYAGSVIEVAHTDVESGSVLQSQKAEKALEKLNNQRDLFPPPERRLALIISQVQGLKETDHQGQVSQELRIFHEAYLATTGYDIGTKGILVAFDFDYFRDALYPGWRDRRNKQGKPVSFHTANRDRIRQSIDNMRKAYIDVDGLGPIAPVVSRTPVEKLSRGKDKVVLDVIAPSGTRRGGLIIANTMRQLGFLGGQGSARKYAFYHALVQYWDDHGTQNGKIIWPTIPKKLRDGEGRLIEDKVVLDVIAPSGTRRGGLIIANTMRQLGFLGGQGSARKYAFYHALVQYWDQHGTQNKKIIWPTIPKKLRDGEGRLIDENGAVILDKNGKPETRWKKGVQVYKKNGGKSYVDNKDERLAYYPVVSRAELASFFGKDRWREAKALLDEMEADKIFTMQEVGDGYRFFPSVEHCLAYVDVRESASVGS